MQLQYCEACQTRIDDGAVTVGDRVLCKPCALTAKANMPAPSSSAVRKAVRGSGAVLRPDSTPGTAKRSPAAGARRGPISSASRLPAQGGGHARIGTTRTRPIPAPPPESAAPEQEAVQAAPPPGRKTLVCVFAVAGVLVVLAAVVWIARGSKKAGGAVPPKESTETRKQNEPDAGSAAEKKATEPGAAAQGEKKGLEPAHKGMGFLAAETGDIREDSARRELAKLVEMEQSGKGSAGELRQRYESLVASRGATAAGQEAARRLKALPPLPLRPADQAPVTEPGLHAAMHEKAGDVRLPEKRFSEMKNLGALVAKNLDYPTKDNLFAFTKGRRSDLVLDISGFLAVPRDGEYTFYLDSDDGSALWLGDDLVIENDGDHGMREQSGVVRLAAGKHRLRVAYWQGTGDAGLILRWSGPGINKETVPASALSHAR